MQVGHVFNPSWLRMIVTAMVGQTLLAAAKPICTKQQSVACRRGFKRLYEEGLIIDDFYIEKVAECEAVH